nr:sigma 54-interacting transcriptional regulator [uncultured Aminipila sp.]
MNMELIPGYILDNADIGFRVVDENGIVVYCNDIIGKIMNIKREDMIGKHLFEIHEHLDEGSSTLITCLRTGRTIHNKVKPHFGKKGEIIYLVTTNIPIIQNEEIVGVIEYIKTEDSFGDLYNYISKDQQNSFNLKNTSSKNLIGYDFDDFLTIETKMISLIENVKQMSLYGYNVLIYGETGTGKEIIAQSIHNRSQRKNNAFIAQNCAAIPENLLESIFFGTVAGSFTGASDSSGLFEQANGGTLFLDELNSLPFFLQAKLLRVLQEGFVRRIGGKKDIRVDVRIICTTNEAPEDLLKGNRLRQDLFYRLGPIYVNIPPLRQRKLDIDYLTKIFIKRESKYINVREPKISKEVKDFFRKYSWQGNVRELKNVISYILLNSSCADTVELEHLPNYMHNSLWDLENVSREFDDNLNYQQKIDEFEKVLIKNALIITRGNVSEASKILEIKRQTLQYKIKKMGIQ